MIDIQLDKTRAALLNFNLVCRTSNIDSRLLLNRIYMDPVAESSCSGETAPVALSKRAKRKQKRLFAKERRKEYKKLTKGLTNNKDPGFDESLFSQAEYYFENGLRKVYPYYFKFNSFCKKRWIGKTVLEIFTKDFHGTDTDEYIEAIESGKVKVGGKPVAMDYKVKAHDYLEHVVHRHENPVVGTPLEIIHDDSDVVVINKPASIPCHPCGRYRFNSIAFILGKEYGYPRLRNIYRLDRLTSGVLILAKTPEKTRQLEDEVLGKHVQKEYVCRVVGEFPKDEVICDQPIDIISHKISMHKIGPNGKPSKTIFKRLSYNGKTSVVKCRPITGRTHQIRVHLQFLGHPIINDPLYNSPAFGPNRGKGGNFWKSDTEIVDEIQNLHNIGLWYKGENPLYNKRLKEIKEQQEKTKFAQDKEENSKKGNNQQSEIAIACDDQNDNISELRSCEPNSKRVKLDTDSSGTKKTKTSEENVIEILPSETDHSNNTCSNSETSVEKFENDTSSDLTSRCEHQSEKSGKKEVIIYNEFDESKWMPDEHCSCCRRNYIDPSPSHLVMYLHALSYKGSDWSYSTELPEWAEEDWDDDTEAK